MAKEKPGHGSDHTRPPEPQRLVVSGLDMGPTIDWYTANEAGLTGRIPLARKEALSFSLEGESHFHVSPGEVSALVGLFPNRALRRSRLNGGAIIGSTPLYFARNSTVGKIKTTSDPAQALSPTAIIPSFTDNTRWLQTGTPSSDVLLFEITKVVPEGVRRIIHAQGLVHEIAHTITTQALHTDSYRLRLPNGKVVPGFDFMISFAGLAEKHDPVSHYSSFYRGPGEEFKTLLAIEEVFVETVAARLLGFAFSDNPDRRLNPLADRPEIMQMVDAFLGAEEVMNDDSQNVNQKDNLTDIA